MKEKKKKKTNVMSGKKQKVGSRGRGVNKTSRSLSGVIKRKKEGSLATKPRKKVAKNKIIITNKYTHATLTFKFMKKKRKKRG